MQQIQHAISSEAHLVRLFSEFLLARQQVLSALAPGSPDDLQPVLRSAAVCFMELARELLPGTPEEILIELTKNIVLNVCRVAHLNAPQDAPPETDARVIEMIF